LGWLLNTNLCKITAKGTSQRSYVYRDYDEEIDAIYKMADAAQEALFQLPEEVNIISIKDYIKKVVSVILDRLVLEEEDFYVAGMDSLQNLELARVLRSASSTDTRRSQRRSQLRIYTCIRVSSNYLILFTRRSMAILLGLRTECIA
jgi:hypothetical protein